MDKCAESNEKYKPHSHYFQQRRFGISIAQNDGKTENSGISNHKSHYAFKHTRGGDSIARADSVVGLSSRVGAWEISQLLQGGCLRQKRGIIHQLLSYQLLRILTMSPVEYLAGSQLTQEPEIVCRAV